MPSRATCLAIILYWLIAAGGLFVREVLPDLLVGPPPDLRSMSQAEADNPNREVHWTIQVEDPARPGGTPTLRPVGQVKTSWARTEDGGSSIDTDVQLESGELLKTTGFATGESVRLAIPSRFLVDVAGNLVSFHTEVRASEDATPLVTLDGVVSKPTKTMELRSRGLIPLLTIKKSIPYEPRSMIQSAIGPIDRLPGLRVGQRWRSQVVSPLTGRVESMQVEVVRQRVIQWGQNPVTVLEVVQSLPPVSARTWVRPDGLVIRQEMPLPVLKLIIERVPE